VPSQSVDGLHALVQS